MDDVKSCSKGDNEKELSEFNFRKDTQKYRNQYGGCIRLINKDYQTMKKEQIKKRRKKYCEDFKRKNLRRMYDIYYRERNREKIQLYKKNYFQRNKQELYKKIKKRKDEDIIFRLACFLRKRVLKAFKTRNVRKTNKTFYLLGCSHSFL